MPYPPRVVLLVAALLALNQGPSRAETSPTLGKAAYHEIARQEAQKRGLPVDVADAVMAIESGYDPTRIGGVGEIGLMQVRPATAAMLGFTGTAAELAKPETNIRLGVTYLAEAWRRTNGNLCRALMKYRAGHGEEVMTPLSVTYCDRARAHLASIGSPLAQGFGSIAIATAAAPADAPGANKHRRILRGPAFWAAQEVRVRTISARIEKRWRVMAAR